MRLIFSTSLLLLFILYTNSYSQLEIKVKFVDKENIKNIDLSEFPLIKAQIKVLYNNNQVEIKKEDCNILEYRDIYTVKLKSITPIIDGWQTITWIPELDEFKDSLYPCYIHVLYNNIIARAIGIGTNRAVPIAQITNYNHGQIRDLVWSNIPPGNAIAQQVRFRGSIINYDSLNSYSLRLDSITTNTPYFVIDWLGSDSDVDKKPPPRFLRVGSYYWINIVFKPTEYKYYQDILTFHYEGGLKRSIPLYANSYTVTTKSMIELITPNGNEKLAPCDEFLIKWKGHAPQFPVDLFYTDNNGATWIKIATVKDSVYKWTVPDINSKNIKIKVRQNFVENENYNISQDLLDIGSAGYNQHSTLLSYVNNNGKVFTFDLKTQNPTFIREHYLDESHNTNYKNLGLIYSPSDSIFYVAYKNLDLDYNPDKINDSLAIFNSSSTYPIRKISLAENMKIRKIKSDTKKSIIACIPTFSNLLFLYKSDDLSLIKKFTFPTQVIDVSLNTENNQIACLFLDGEVTIYDLDDFREQKKFNFNDMTNFTRISLSPNGRLLFLSSKADYTGMKVDSYVLEVNSGLIVRVFKPSHFDVVDAFFSPSSSTLIIGSSTDKQIAFYDLTLASFSGELDGHPNYLNDIQLSPDGHSLITTSKGYDNAIYRTFVYPEEDWSDESFSIIKPIITQSDIKFNPVYLGTFNNYDIKTVCNIGEVAANYIEAKFQTGTNYFLSKNWEPSYLEVGDCLNFNINFNPIDTGYVRDTLLIKSCNTYYRIPFEIYVFPRNIEFVNQNYNFGEVCIGDTINLKIPLLKNNDPVPLLVNYATFESPYNRNFKIYIPKTDTLVPAYSTLEANIVFIPDTIGQYNPIATIYHSNQKKIKAEFNLIGQGIGSFVSTSHDHLLFIPEVPIRELEIKNSGTSDIVFNNFTVLPPDNFKVLTPRGFTLKPNESKIIQIEWNGIKQPASLKIDATPCLVQRYIPLEFYEGTATITLPEISTSSRNENLEIPIEYKVEQKLPYKGNRPLEAIIEVNPKIFLPTSITSTIGDAEIISNEINQNRQIKILINGNFDSNGIIATLKGVAGLTDTNYSDLKFNHASSFFGEYVFTKYNNGSIFIDDICYDRYISNTNQGIVIQNISPNPANEHININFDAIKEQNYYIEIINNLGEIVCSIKSLKTRIGQNIITINTNELIDGNYTINLYYDTTFVSASFIKIR